jgi:trigger factor
VGLAELVIDEVPDAMVNGEMSEQLQQLAMQLQGQGMNMEQWLSMTGQDPASFTGELKVGAERSAKVDLALRALARQEELEVSDEDLDEEIERIATQLEEAASEIRHRLEHGDGYAPIRSDLLKRQAMEWLIEQVNLVDEDGQAIDRSDLEPPELPTTSTEPESSDEDDGSPDPKAEAAED